MSKTPNENWIEAVEHARQGNETHFNKIVASSFKQDFYTPILQMTKDKSIVEDIYIMTITKFWERFVLKGEDLPNSNINGYLFQMARNAFFELKRKQNTAKASMFVTMDASEIYESYSSYMQKNESLENLAPDSDKTVLLRSIYDAMTQLDPICIKIIEKNILENRLLKTIIEEMSLSGTYNSIVKKKKRCIKKLKELLNTHISSNSIILQTHTNDA